MSGSKDPKSVWLYFREELKQITMFCTLGRRHIFVDQKLAEYVDKSLCSTHMMGVWTTLSMVQAPIHLFRLQRL